MDEGKDIPDEEKIVRCFIAVDFPKEICDEIMRVQGELEGLNLGSRMRLTEKNNLHLTLKFLGEIRESKVEEVRKKLGEIKLGKFEGNLGELGVFTPSFIKIIWISVLGKEMEEMQKEIDEKLAGLFAPERRFMSHLTVARVNGLRDNKGFLREMKRIRVRKLKFIVNSFSLIKSELGEKGPKYSDIEKFKLQA